MFDPTSDKGLIRIEIQAGGDVSHVSVEARSTSGLERWPDAADARLEVSRDRRRAASPHLLVGVRGRPAMSEAPREERSSLQFAPRSSDGRGRPARLRCASMTTLRVVTVLLFAREPRRLRVAGGRRRPRCEGSTIASGRTWSTRTLHTDARAPATRQPAVLMLHGGFDGDDRTSHDHRAAARAGGGGGAGAELSWGEAPPRRCAAARDASSSAAAKSTTRARSWPKRGSVRT